MPLALCHFRRSTLETLEEKLGYHFKNKELLKEALRHSSFLNEDSDKTHQSNERLEFLGDSVLGLTAVEYLFRKYSRAPEGTLTRMKSALVCEGSLYLTARDLDLGSYLQFGTGEMKVGGNTRPSILADAMEAVFGAVFLDSNWETVRELIYRLILSDEEARLKLYFDYKSALQEYVQRDAGNTFSYELIGEEGPEHQKTFYSRVLLNGKEVGKGSGSSKKESQQEAARNALEALKVDEHY